MVGPCLITRLLRNDFKGLNNETHLSTVGDSSQTYPRLSCSYGYPWRSCRDSCSSCQGSSSFGRLNAEPNAESPAGNRRQSNAAFPKRYRLTKTDEFSSVFGFRKALKSPHFLLHYRLQAAEEGTGARLGLVVAKRFLRRSVDRNLIRRLAREHFRLLRSRLPARDLILRLASKPVALERRALAVEIRGLLSKIISPER